MDAFKEIEAIPKGKTIFSALGSTSLNALGGWLAGRVRGTLASFAPTIKGGGSIGIFLVALGLKYWARKEQGLDRVIKEVAAGMAGFVGNDLWFVVKSLIGWGKWKPDTAYKEGDVVLMDKDYYKAEKDIPATPAAEPGKDSRWVRFEMAQAITISDVSAFAQALNGNDALLDGLVKEQLLIFGPELAQQYGRELNQDEADRIYSGMRDSLKSVVMNFTNG